MNTKKNRVVVLDTETTGMNNTGIPHLNHRIIEIGAIEIINRRFTKKNFHIYIQPDRKIDPRATKIHGITNAFLSNKPLFKDIAENFFNYIKNSTLVIHNASFDIGFINQEFSITSSKEIDILKFCNVIDTLKIARNFFPGKKNTLDALCSRYKIQSSHRVLHGAILDAFLLSKVYLLMTSKQESILFDTNIHNKNNCTLFKIKKNKISSLKILQANNHELMLHEKYLMRIRKIYDLK